MIARDKRATEIVKAPTIPYPGAKGRLAPTLVSFMPEQGGMFLDMFAGRGNVFWAAAINRRFKRWTVNDIATARFFKAIWDHGASMSVPIRTREEFVRQRDRFGSGDPTAILLEPYLTYSGGGYRNGGFGGARSASAKGYQTTLRRCSEILRSTRATILARDWHDLPLTRLGADDFAFIDPPYLGADVRAYSSSQFDYPGLVRALVRAKFRWLLTEYRQPIYEKCLGAPFYERHVQLACDNLRTRTRVECCWKNY